MSVIGFCWTVSPMRGTGLAFVVLAGLGAYLLAADVADLVGYLCLLLLVQMLATSRGFRAAALRGHFDPLLVAGRSRSTIACAHWAASAAPGGLTWIGLGLVELAVRGPGEAIALRAASVVALALVSVVPWVVSLAGARLAGGVLWLCGLAGLLVTRSGAGFLREAFEQATLAPPGAMAGIALAHGACPFLLIRPAPEVLEPALVGGLAIAALVVWMGALIAAAFLDVPLYPTD